jgi:hypothetical protein
MDAKTIPRLQAKSRTWVIEGNDFIAAYYELHRQVME